MNGTRLTFFLIFASVLISCRKDEPAPATHDQELSEDALVFLRDYMLPLDPSSLEGLEFLDPAGLEDYQFIFSGESHGTQGNFAMDLAMLKYLNEIGWLDYYSPEMPFSFCWFVNHFLETGDEEMLKSIAQQLHTKADSPLKGKILSLMYIYQGSTFLNNNPYRVQPMPPPVFEKDFESLNLGAFTLFPLSGPMSPFSQSLIWPVSTATPTDGVTTDYFQYLVLVDGSEAVQPIR